MVKKLNAESAAKQIAQALQPAVEFRVTTAHDPRSDPPAKKPLPAPLAKALGQS
jgi:hypothetical protein